MEVTGIVFRQSPCFSSATGVVSNSRHSKSFPVIIKANSFRPSRKSLSACVVSGEFSDKSHLQYYSGERMAIEEVASKKKEMKKKLKVLKGLSKNLSTFSEMGFCLHPDSGLDQQVKGQMISEATEVLIGQLQKLKEESKRMKKEEKAKKKASRMMMIDCKDSSSESSSSESDYDNKVVNMRQVATSEIKVTSSNNVDEEDCGKKIEVCMGGKCNKSGATMLLESFQKAMGGEAEVVVVGCKCMGKCREGPNVRVTTQEANSLRMGVGLEDVDTIVTNFFGGTQRSCLSSV